MLAAATGPGSIDVNVSARRWPSSRSITPSATPGLRAGTSSRHQANASVQGSGSAPLAGGDQLAQLHVGRPAGLDQMLRPPDGRALDCAVDCAVGWARGAGGVPPPDGGAADQ